MTTPAALPHTEQRPVPRVEQSWDKSRREWNLLVRAPFYLNLRLGMTQNALWVGHTFDGPRAGKFHVIFNCFPFPWSNDSVFFGHTSKRTVEAMRAYIHRAELKRMEAGE